MTAAITAAVVAGAATVGSAAISANASKKAAKSSGGGGGGGGYVDPDSNLNQASRFANSLFGPTTGNDWGVFAPVRSAVSDYLNDPNLRRPYDFITGGDTMNLYNAAVTNYQNTLRPMLTQMSATGMPTDISSIIAQRKDSFFNDLMPQLRERYIGQTGTFGTDFLNDALTQGRRLETEIAPLQVQADESAKARMLSAAPLLSQYGITYAGLPSALTNDWYTAMLKSNPSTRAIDTLTTIGQLAGQGQYIQQGNNPYGNSGASSISALASALPGVAKSIIGAWPSGTSSLTSGGGGLGGSYYSPGASGFSTAQILGYS